MAVDDRYVKSKVWKCKDSPTGAHHWVQNVDPESNLNLDEMPFICKYCRGVKYMESFYTYSGWEGWNSKKKPKKGASHKPSKFTRNPGSKHGIDNG